MKKLAGVVAVVALVVAGAAMWGGDTAEAAPRGSSGDSTCLPVQGQRSYGQPSQICGITYENFEERCEGHGLNGVFSMDGTKKVCTFTARYSGNVTWIEMDPFAPPPPPSPECILFGWMFPRLCQ